MEKSNARLRLLHVSIVSFLRVSEKPTYLCSSVCCPQNRNTLQNTSLCVPERYKFKLTSCGEKSIVTWGHEVGVSTERFESKAI